jgi:hypothetical protein
MVDRSSRENLQLDSFSNMIGRASSTASFSARLFFLGFRLSTPLTHPTSSSRKKMFAVAANTTVRAVAQVKATKAAAKEQKSA